MPCMRWRKRTRKLNKRESTSGKREFQVEKERVAVVCKCDCSNLTLVEEEVVDLSGDEHWCEVSLFSCVCSCRD